MDDSDGSTWQKYAWFTTGCATVAIILTKSLIRAAGSSPNGPLPWLHLLLHYFLGYLVADLTSGIYHWLMDNYGSTDTPIFGIHVELSIEHHRQPSLSATEQIIRKRLYHIAVPVTVIGLPIAALCHKPTVLAVFATYSGFALFSLLFHKWSHTPPRRLPWAVVVLQDARILLGMVEHASHHRPPFNHNYCFVSGIWNRLLDSSRFFRCLEMLIFAATGVRPRWWKETDLGGIPTRRVAKGGRVGQSPEQD